jgi:hypothetical protein
MINKVELNINVRDVQCRNPVLAATSLKTGDVTPTNKIVYTIFFR